MWIFTITGFFSVVQKPGDEALTVRARARADLDRLRERYLRELSVTVEGAGTDYPYRAEVSRAALGAAMVRIVEDLDYSNFKSMVAKELGSSRASAYHDVWEALLQLTKDEADTDLPARARAAAAERAPSWRPPAYGGVVVDAEGRILLVQPKGQYGGYAWTYPKGRPAAQESPEAAAVREVREESGIAARIVRRIDGVFAGDTTDTVYFIMAPTGEPPVAHDDEIEKICWVTPEEARSLVSLTTTPRGRARDLAVLDAAIAGPLT